MSGSRSFSKLLLLMIISGILMAPWSCRGPTWTLRRGSGALMWRRMISGLWHILKVGQHGPRRLCCRLWTIWTRRGGSFLSSPGLLSWRWAASPGILSHSAVLLACHNNSVNWIIIQSYLNRWNIHDIAILLLLSKTAFSIWSLPFTRDILII